MKLNITWTPQLLGERTSSFITTVFPEVLAKAEATALTTGHPNRFTLFRGTGARYKLSYRIPVP